MAVNPVPPPIDGRLFLAVPLTDGVRADLAAHLAAASATTTGLPGRRVAPENWHFTLRFLGDTHADAGARLHEGLWDAAVQGRLGMAFTLRFGRLGAFPKPERARLLWLGVSEGASALGDVAAAVEREAVTAGFQREVKPFAPHLTLSRLVDQDVQQQISHTPPFDIQLPVDAVVLYRSHLGQGPPRYEPLVRYPLQSTGR